MPKELIIKEPSTLATFESDEVWEIKTQDKTYRITGIQAQALKEVTNGGSRGLVWFKDFAISIPHIISVTKIKSGSQETYKKIESLKLKFNL